MNSLELRGKKIIGDLEVLVLDCLKANRLGLTSAQVERQAGLRLSIPSQRGYIAWSVLQYLRRQGRIRREGRIYFVGQNSRG